MAMILPNKQKTPYNSKLYHEKGKPMFTVIQPYITLCRLDKPIGIYLLLFPVIWALILAGDHHLHHKITLLFVLGVIVMRSLGCIINDMADKEIDPLVTRTRHRPLANGRLSLLQAYRLAIGFACIALLLLLSLPTYCWPYAIPAALLTAIYPFCKRWIQCPQLILGLAFSSAIPMVYSAICHTVPPQAWLLSILSTLWPVIYDTQYALVDKADDQRIGVRSTAIWFGDNVYGILAGLQVMFFAGWIGFGVLYHFSAWSMIPLALAIGIAAYQQRLVLSQKSADAFTAFLSNRWLGCLLCVGIAIA
jgi:4-hydroxybenzoate polyprenyltransferase